MKKILLLLFCFAMLAASAQQVPTQFNAAERNQVIDTLIVKLGRLYAFPDSAKKMTADLQRRRQHDFDTVSDRSTLARLLTADLQAISKDGHLGVEVSATPIGDDNPGSPPDSVVNAFKTNWAHFNFLFKKAEFLEGNIGLLQLDCFFPADWIKDLAAASMTFLANANAVIIDLRDNHGFAPDGVLLMESYFLKDPVHLSDGFDHGVLTQTWTLPTVPGPKLADMDLYILVSKNTFSAPESFAYNLQALGRARIIGEVTGGGAHGTRPFKIGTWFTADIPTGYGYNVTTHSDWEGKGVQPDVKVPAGQALLTAQILAIRTIIKRNPKATERIKGLEEVITGLQQQLDSLAYTAYNRRMTLKQGVIHADTAAGPGVIWANAQHFKYGTIEFDICGKDRYQQSFVGLAFHGLNDTTYEAVYFRPFNFKATDAERHVHGVQYIAVPGFDWPKLRADFHNQYEKTVEPAPGPNDWFHVRLVVSEKNIKVYVNNSPAAALDIAPLAPLRGDRIGFFVGNGSAGDWKNLKILY